VICLQVVTVKTDIVRKYKQVPRTWTDTLDSIWLRVGTGGGHL